MSCPSSIPNIPAPRQHSHPIRHAWPAKLTAALAVAAVGCAGMPQPATRLAGAPPAHVGPVSDGAQQQTGGARADDTERKLAEVAQSHGGAGPWAVAGYRMGTFALQTLGLPRGSFDLEIVHFTPHEVQYACIADGAAAATGASIGKLNLTLESAPRPQTRTVYRRKHGGPSIILRVTDAFARRFLEVPRERLAEAGRAAMQLPDADVFETVKPPAGSVLDAPN
jgi:hypothetical protein